MVRKYYEDANKLDNLDKMDKFLETYNLPKRSQEESENLNGHTTPSEIEAVIKKLSTNKSPRPDGFTGEFYQTFQEELTPLLKLFQKFKRREDFQARSMRLLIVIPKPDKDTTKKENYRPVSLKNINAKILKKIVPNQIQQHIKKITHHDQVGFIPWMQL